MTANIWKSHQDNYSLSRFRTLDSKFMVFCWIIPKNHGLRLNSVGYKCRKLGKHKILHEYVEHVLRLYEEYISPNPPDMPKVLFDFGKSWGAIGNSYIKRKLLKK